MSRIYFHSEHGEAEVSGSERAHMCVMISDIAFHCLQFDYYKTREDPLFKLVPNNYVTKSTEPDFARFMSVVHNWFFVGDAYFQHDKVLPDKISAFTVSLNTAMVLGSDPLKLFARLHGQCELHCYVEGKNRKWLASIISSGYLIGLMRENMGWDKVIMFLQERDDCPVVCSYSVCDQFPNKHMANWADDCDGDGWYELAKEKKWELALKGLRERGNLEMKPENWATYYFGTGENAFSLRKKANQLKEETQDQQI